MTNDSAVWIGADPGGRGRFGIAMLKVDSELVTACVDCARDAVGIAENWVADNMLAAIGVDSPLWWSSGLGSDRMADQWLRRRYRLWKGQVQAANSLRGAALVQGAMFIERMRNVFGHALPVTEVHPKALLKGVFDGNMEAFAAKHQIEGTWEKDHERDAVIAAVAAREGFGGRWTNDLSINRTKEEQDPQTCWLGPVHYFWPES